MMASEVDAEAPTGMPSILELLDLEYIEEDIYRSRAVFKFGFGFSKAEGLVQPKESHPIRFSSHAS